MKKGKIKTSAPTRCSRDRTVARTEPSRSGATRRSRGRCPSCQGDGWNVYGRIDKLKRITCSDCQGSGRANS